MRLATIIAAALLCSAPANAQLRRVEMKTLGMD